MGGKKSNYYHDDLWNLKYLPKFKWLHLTEQLAYERQQRAKQLQLEVAQAKTEMDMYLKNVEKSKMIRAMEDKKMRKRQANDDVKGETTLKEETSQVRRRFKQRKVIDDRSGQAMNAAVKGVMSQLLT